MSVVSQRLSKQNTALIVNPNLQERSDLENYFLATYDRVLTTATGDEAVELCRDYKGPINVLITELELPGLCGWKLAEEAAKVRPGLLVLFLSAAYVSAPRDPSAQGMPAARADRKLSAETLLQVTHALSYSPQLKRVRN